MSERIETAATTAAPLTEVRVPKYAKLMNYLRSVQRLDRKISSMKHRLSTCNTESENDCDGESRVEIRKRIETLLDMFRERYKEISRLIDQLEYETERRVLTERYLNYHSWDAIAVALDMRPHHVQEIHGSALIEIDRIIQQNRAEAAENDSETADEEIVAESPDVA